MESLGSNDHDCRSSHYCVCCLCCFKRVKQFLSLTPWGRPIAQPWRVGVKVSVLFPFLSVGALGEEQTYFLKEAFHDFPALIVSPSTCCVPCALSPSGTHWHCFLKDECLLRTPWELLLHAQKPGETSWEAPPKQMSSEEVVAAEQSWWGHIEPREPSLPAWSRAEPGRPREMDRGWL